MEAARTYDPFRTARKAAYIGKLNIDLQQQIRQWLWDTKEVSIPPSRKEYRNQLQEIFDFDAYDDALYNECNELCKFHYSLGENRMFLAQFTTPNLFEQLNRPVGQYYSKHRLDPIWNSSKSRKFRFVMARFLNKEKWYEQYQPTHLVLTVPHKGGIWQGKRIYIHELIKAFHELRHQRWWKKHIHGGLYCLEVKKNKENGYHIHLHVLCFQQPRIVDHRTHETSQQPVNYTRDRIVESWRKIVGNDTGYDGVHYSSLYFYERDEAGKMIPVENCYYMTSDEDPEDETMQEISQGQFKKYYVKRGDDPQLWTKGVMECLKYHFKPGVLTKHNSQPNSPSGGKGAGAQYDIELIMELLGATKGDRFMSKFGALHNHAGLSLTGKIQTEAEDEADLDNELLGSAAAAEAELINPFTDEPATPEDYQIVMTSPANLIVGHDARGRPNIRLHPHSHITYFEPGVGVTEAFRMYAAKKFDGKRLFNTNTDLLAMNGNGFRLDRPPTPVVLTRAQVEFNDNYYPDSECPF